MLRPKTVQARLLCLVLCLSAALSAFAGDDEVRLAYLIGVGRYQGGLSKGTFLDLPVVNDIEAIGGALLAIGFAAQDVMVFTDSPDSARPVGSVLTYRTPLTSHDAPGARVGLSHFTKVISDALIDLEERKARGVLLIYFSGHGGAIYPESGDVTQSERVLAFPNSHSDDPDSFAKVYELLEKLAQRAPTIQKVLIVDACASRLNARPTTRAQSRSPEGLPVHFFSSKLGQPSYYRPDTKTSLFTGWSMPKK
jgi:hypothetical protein